MSRGRVMLRLEDIVFGLILSSCGVTMSVLIEGFPVGVSTRASLRSTYMITRLREFTLDSPAEAVIVHRNEGE